MKGTDLKVGLVVALPGTSDYVSRDYDYLGKPGNLRAIVLDTRRVWRRVHDAQGGGDWVPRPVGDEPSRYNGTKARYALAVEHQEVREVGDDYELTGAMVWEPHLVSARTILGTWAEHETLLIQRQAELAEAQRRHRSEAQRLARWADRVEEAFRWAGLEYRPPEVAAERVSIPVTVLDQLVAFLREPEVAAHGL